jgi:hypothetical protein
MEEWLEEWFEEWLENGRMIVEVRVFDGMGGKYADGHLGKC